MWKLEKSHLSGQKPTIRKHLVHVFSFVGSIIIHKPQQPVVPVLWSAEEKQRAKATNSQ